MKNKFILPVGIFAAIIVSIFSCGKTDSTVTATTDFSFTEEFDTVSKAVAKGWVIKNNTRPLGTIGWTQGYFYVSMYHGLVPKNLGTLPFNFPAAGGFGDNNPSFSGSDFIMTTSECGFNIANCSNWLISPEVTIKNGDEISFYTRTYDNPAIAGDRLEVRLNVADGSSDVGRDSGSTGHFTKVLLDINPGYFLQGNGSYPGVWTNYTATVTDFPIAKKSSIAFRYYVPDGGPQGPNGLGVGIDKFKFTSK
jgi:hypothetical protein